MLLVLPPLCRKFHDCHSPARGIVHHGTQLKLCTRNKVLSLSPKFLILFKSLTLSIRYGELDDVHITLRMSNMAAQELGVEAFEEPSYHNVEERLRTRSPCAQSYHYIFKMMVQCILMQYRFITIISRCRIGPNHYSNNTNLAG